MRCFDSPDVIALAPDGPVELRRSFELERVRESARRVRIALAGDLAFGEASRLWLETRQAIAESKPGEALGFDLSGVKSADGASIALLVQLRAELRERGVAAEFVGAEGQVKDLVHTYHGDTKPKRRKRKRAESTLSQIGRSLLEVFHEFKLVFAFFGSMLIAGLAVVRRPRRANWGEITSVMERAGADAVPIVVIINFLVGFVMAYQGAVQLKQFGANIYVADLVGLSVTRELGPLMTAIIAAGRSGAAFAAELGTMKVSEEVDALRSLGFGPMRYLVLPRAIALVAVLPLLTLLADFVGLLGGLVVGVTSLDLTMTAYFVETRAAIAPWDVFSGIIKSGVFALAIALISCQQGLATSGGAEGVGRRTTSSVVSSLFAIIAIDAIFTIFFDYFEL